jgi:transposase-like protein
LRIWFRAIWWVTNQKTGMTAVGLQRALGLGSYRTAWMMLHKLRRAMVRPGREGLTGEVEVDDIYVGGVEPGVHGRETLTKAIVVIAAEVKGRGMGRIRLQHVPDVSARSLVGFVQAAVEPGALVRTDGWEGYAPLRARGYRHRVRIAPDRAAASRLLPRVHRVASLLKRWLLGTHQGRVELKHLQRYLDEYAFRFNRRTSRHRGMLFFRVLEHAIALPPTPYRQVIQGQHPESHKL